MSSPDLSSALQTQTSNCFLKSVTVRLHVSHAPQIRHRPESLSSFGEVPHYAPILMAKSWESFLTPSPFLPNLSHQASPAHPSSVLDLSDFLRAQPGPPNYLLAFTAARSLPSPMTPPCRAARPTLKKQTWSYFPPDQNLLMAFDPSLDKVQTSYVQQGSMWSGA